MSEQVCIIDGCTHSGYAPAGTGQLCKEHFSEFVKWRRKKGGLAMFRKYNGMTMEERDTVFQQWEKSLTTSK
jgi:hypothetical protein